MTTGTPPGRDRRIVRHVAPAGATDASSTAGRPEAVVVGGGIAGLAAATGLVERGVAVTVLEQQPMLGGRVASWQENHDGQLRSMSRGFHAFFRQYYNLRALLRRADPGLDRLVRVRDYPLVDAHGRRESFRGLPRTPPWNALAFALRSPTFRLRDLARLDARAAAPLADLSVPEVYDSLDTVDAETFLRGVRFPPAARHLAFEVFSRSFFAPPEMLSAAELATMFHIFFLGSSEGLLFDLPTHDYSTALWDPLHAYLDARGVDFRIGRAATAVDHTAPGRFRVHDATGATWTADGVVLATDIAGLRGIVAASPGLADQPWRDRVVTLRTAPPFLVRRLWLDRPVAAGRPAFLATGGLPPLDNVSVLERYETQAREWAHRHGGSVVELHAYAAQQQTGTAEAALHRLHALYPETAEAGIVADTTLWRRDCPLFGVGEFAGRPTVRTPFDGLVLAGDGVRIDLPVALMERAATTGWHAANCLLTRWGLAGHTVFSVPTRGRLAPLRRLAIRGG